MSDDLDRIRWERDRRHRPTREAGGFKHPPFLGRVTTLAPSPGHFIKVIPQGLLGTESEGSAGTSTDLGSTAIPVYLVSGTPATGDQVVSRWVDYRWVTRRRGGGTGSGPGDISGCGCQHTPSPLTLTHVGTYSQVGIDGLPHTMDACNQTIQTSGAFCTGGTFDPVTGICTQPVIPDATLVWGPTPSRFLTALSGVANSYLSNASFPDYTGLIGSNYYWYLTCNSNTYFLSRLYDAPTPFLDPALYIWGVNGTTNTCVPFSLAGGSPSIGTGLNPQCSIVITG